MCVCLKGEEVCTVRVCGRCSVCVCVNIWCKDVCLGKVLGATVGKSPGLEACTVTLLSWVRFRTYESRFYKNQAKHASFLTVSPVQHYCSN